MSEVTPYTFHLRAVTFNPTYEVAPDWAKATTLSLRADSRPAAVRKAQAVLGSLGYEWRWEVRVDEVVEERGSGRDPL